MTVCERAIPAVGHDAADRNGTVHHVEAEVLEVTRLGPYWRLSLLAPSIAASHSPGQFLSVAVGAGLETPLRRCFSVLDADPRTGRVDFAFAIYSQGTLWLARRQPAETIDVVGPLGRGFPPPPSRCRCLLIGGGHGAAALYRLVRDCSGRGNSVHVILGAGTRDLLFGVELFTEIADSVSLTTDDGSAGLQGTVCTALPEIVASLQPTVIYAAGPMPMLRAVAEQASATDVPSYVATEAAMACAIGVCMTCVLPIVSDDGVTRMTRICVDGPVFRGDLVRWADVGTVPADCWGA
jgi:dihydroorotate dehydrogenase electron transfer subunit